MYIALHKWNYTQEIVILRVKIVMFDNFVRYSRKYDDTFRALNRLSLILIVDVVYEHNYKHHRCMSLMSLLL